MTVDPRDVTAKEQLDEYAAKELPRIKARADKWIAGLAAITGVLTTAALIKGPDTLTKVSNKNLKWLLSPRDIVVIALVAGGIGLGWAIYKGYRAANGSPLFDDELSKLATGQSSDITGLADKWTKAAHKSASQSRAALRFATSATLVGVALLAFALVYASYNPAPATPDTSTCVTVDNHTVQFDGSLPPVTSGSVTEVACPTPAASASATPSG